MARVKITEYKAKQLILSEEYRGIQLKAGENPKVPAGRYVLKVDQGVKKRMKQGLVAIDVAPADFTKHLSAWEKKGFTQFLAEPFIPHEQKEERYLSIERVREGLRVLYAKAGGIDIEENPSAVEQFLIRENNDSTTFCKKTGCPKEFVQRLIDVFERNFFAFLEINPLVIQNGTAHLLDAAVLVDSAGEFFTKGARTEAIVKGKAKHEAETRIEELAATTPASLKLSVVNENGSLFFLLSGGGGSIVIADEAGARGMGKEMGNYGEYSGGPSREETYLYAKEVLGLLLASKAKKKALIVAGGVANFTDIKETFAGVIDALTEVADTLRSQGVKVFVRRGGPNEEAGLAHMKIFLEKEKLLGSIHGSNTVITKAVDDAIDYIKQ